MLIIDGTSQLIRFGKVTGQGRVVEGQERIIRAGSGAYKCRQIAETVGTAARCQERRLQTLQAFLAWFSHKVLSVDCGALDVRS
jgi:hypothetical protein